MFEEGEELAEPEVSVVIRGSEIKVDLREYAQANELAYPPAYGGPDLTRSLVLAKRPLLLLTEEALSAYLLPEMKLLARLEEWRHPDLSGEELPSDSIFFRSLAEALAEGDASRIDASETPNGHWKHWPDSGTL